MLVAKGHGIIV